MHITAFKTILARRINIRGCDDYKNTFARMESDCTLRFGLKALTKSISYTNQSNLFVHFLLPFSLMRNFGKQNIRWNVSKIFVTHTCCWKIGSKSTNHSPLAWRRIGQKIMLVAMIGGFRSDLSTTRMLVTRKIDGYIGNVSVDVFFSKVAY